MSNVVQTNPLAPFVRSDLPGRFNELDVLRRHWPRFAAVSQGAVVPPYEVLIHPSSGCNLRCAWCIGDHVPLELWDEQREQLVTLDAAKDARDRLPDHLASPENMLKLIGGIVDYEVAAPYRQGGEDRSSVFKVEAVSFSGLIGEPLVARKALIPAFTLLAERGIRYGIFTNAVLMDDACIEALLPAGYVHISIDAGTPETYADLKYGGRKAGKVMFERALANLTRLVQRRAETGSDVEINTSFVMYPENYHEVYAAARLIRQTGADSLRLKQDNSGERPLTPEQASHASRLIEQIRSDLTTDTFRLLEIHKVGQTAEMARTCSTCSITDLMAAVGSDGCLYPCNYHPRPGGFSYGSALDKSFATVWEGQLRRELRSQLPVICPKVCDPFKNRSNRLLAEAKQVVATSGIDRLEGHVADLVNGGAYLIER
ncbi:Radical SAM domain protein [Actinobacteria bacterium OV320]|nr:Radical SAM domain protein [Actinobacteria bacterium OV320]